MDSKVCRLCCENEASLNIFNSQTRIKEKIIHCCSNLTVKEGDELPTSVCVPCEQELSSCYQFVLKCEASEKKLLSIVSRKFSSKIEVKVERVCTEEEYDDLLNIEEDGNENDNDLFSLSPGKALMNVDHDTHENKLEINEEKDEINKDSTKEKNIIKQRRRKSSKKRPKYKMLNLFTCPECGRQCPNQSTLSIHMRSHTNERPFPCPSCDKCYKDSGGLKRHTIRNHKTDQRARNFICEHCGKGFFTKGDVTTHMRIHTGETPYSCPQCPMRFSQISAMIRHKRRHTGEKSHSCPECSKRFCTKEELKCHLSVHSKEKNYACPICNMPIKYRNNLTKHIKMHSEKNIFMCNHCGRTFAAKGNLKKHIDRQHSEKSGQCSICAKSVANIEMHMWRHTGHRPLKCDLCTSSFYEPKALAHHINFKHVKTDKYKCEVEGCLKSFPSRPMLDFHTAKLHGTQIPFPCDKCARGFYRKNDLARHKISTHKERLS